MDLSQVKVDDGMLQTLTNTWMCVG